MGLFSDSKSYSSSNTTNTQTTKENNLATEDNRVGYEGSSIGGNVSTGQTSGDVIVNSLDGGALKNANQLSLAALDFGADSLESSAGVAGEALMSNEAVAGQAMDLTGDAIMEVGDFARDALGTVEYNSDRAFGFGESAMDRLAIGTSEALGFGSEAIDTVEQANRDTIDTLSDNFQFWSEQSSQTVDRSMAFVESQNRSEGAGVLDAGIKALIWGGGIIGATLVLREAFKQGAFS
ncbi:hypothetical protein [Marinimicrobium agarilyticum]|uniref:hypothetical protein n=1 Tax=Marinimicrobium agarilyticum TaxID=306546 RepID=UPI00041E3A8D|nr:hypothetical protein [Marinimicrobium agarilyticum]